LATDNVVRKNISTLSLDELLKFRDSFFKLHQNYFFPDGVSGFFKQDQIHQATHVHGGPGFLPWHRELCNRFEKLLQQVQPGTALHYYDFSEDLEEAYVLDQNGDKVFLFGGEGLFGASHGLLTSPFNIFHNNGNIIGSRTETIPPDPTKPPISVTRDMGAQNPFPYLPYSYEELISKADDEDREDQWNIFRSALEFNFHNPAHNYIGGNIGGDTHSSFEDVFCALMLHSNVDRLWASWQIQPECKWRLNPNDIYGFESSDPQITEYLEPWAGGASHPKQRIRPWGIDWPNELKKANDDSIVRQIPKYDSYVNIS
jgi:Common central domain of tyrosinase